MKLYFVARVQIRRRHELDSVAQATLFWVARHCEDVSAAEIAPRHTASSRNVLCGPSVIMSSLRALASKVMSYAKRSEDVAIEEQGE